MEDHDELVPAVSDFIHYFRDYLKGDVHLVDHPSSVRNNVSVREHIFQLVIVLSTSFLALDQVFDSLLKFRIIFHVLQCVLRSHQERVFEILF